MAMFIDGKCVIRPARGPAFRVITAADTCFEWEGASAEADIQAGRAGEILRGVQPTLDAADLRVVQWETVLTESDKSIPKSGPPLKASPQCVRFAQAGRFDVALLANNHIGDYGPAGALETAKHLRAAGVQTVGVGENPDDADRVLVVERNGWRIAIVNVAENEYGMATPERAGGTPMNLPRNLRALRQARENADLTLVYLHAGTETLPMPSPRGMETARAFADAGAHAVINIHAHCPQGAEIYHGVPIVYCPGNFFFPRTKAGPGDWWWTGYMPDITFDRSGAVAMDVHPYRFGPDPWRIEPLTNAERAAFLRHLERLCAIASDLTQSRRLFEAWAADMGCRIMKWICEGGQPYPKDHHDPQQVEQVLALRNLLTCESHHDLLRTAMMLVVDGRVDEAMAHRAELESLRSTTIMSAGAAARA